MAGRLPIAPAVGWIGLYALLCFGPLALMLAGVVPPGRGFWVDFAVGLGFLALAVMCLQFLITARYPRVGSPFGSDILLFFHRQAGILAFVLLLGHVTIILAANPAYFSFFDPRENLPRAGALLMALAAMAVLLGTSLWRGALGLRYEWWRLVHAGLAGLIVFIGLVHILMVDYFVNAWFKKGAWILLVGVALAALAHVRVARPWLNRRRPWRVTGVRKEADRTWTLAIEAHGHGGMRFKPGQYAWVTVGGGLLNLQQHPFTIASSARRPERLEFAIKELGDFTATVPRIAAGTPVYLEGPCGHFTLRAQAPATVFIAGGIGVSPALAMLRTLRDSGTNHPFHLFHAAGAPEKLAFAAELRELEKQLDFHYVPIVEEPSDDWNGETGVVTAALLERHLQEAGRNNFDYMICGPDPMILAVHQALMELKIPKHHQRAERFDMV